MKLINSLILFLFFVSFIDGQNSNSKKIIKSEKLTHFNKVDNRYKPSDGICYRTNLINEYYPNGNLWKRTALSENKKGKDSVLSLQIYHYENGLLRKTEEFRNENLDTEILYEYNKNGKIIQQTKIDKDTPKPHHKYTEYLYPEKNKEKMLFYYSDETGKKVLSGYYKINISDERKNIIREENYKIDDVGI